MCKSLTDSYTQCDNKGLEHTIVEINAGIAFPGIGNHFFVAGKIPEQQIPGAPKGPKLPVAQAHNEFKNLTLKDLLLKAQPPVKLEDVVDRGALIGVSFFWTCDVADLACQPGVVVKRLDNGKGFSQKRSYHETLGGKSKRDAVFMYGLRILVESSGIGRQFSVVLLVIQIGSCLALLRTASMAADVMMLQLYPRVRREAYYKCKVQETKDYSDLQDRLNLIAEAQESESLLESDKIPKGEMLSLGLGGKGGTASNIWRKKP